MLAITSHQSDDATETANEINGIRSLEGYE